ncbi:hypothetical protein EFA46_015550 (plasmid) [Halarchaeum sp. CBA1220]|uniref:hypothetical protein n=1 Tax=Halarchaeum sp. CBA1220 TaxID=1853682 RepID=UPI000F3A961D|nr:hypothetical protein [Halarchaeum sp. CBA1220]QLC35673.1 hypothetical protein EFA46_015550 [Halarchaeum sp. CBA1220]
MADPSTNTPFDTDSDASSTTPLYSPVTTTNIYHAVTDLGYPTEYVPIVARALDEFQLAISAANSGHFLLDQLVPQAERFAVLDVNRVTGRTRLEDLLFFSGPYTKTILTDAIGIAMPEFEGPATGHPNPMSPTSFGVDDDHHDLDREGEHKYGYADVDIDVDLDFALSSLDEDRLLPGIDSHVMRAEVQQIAELAFAFYRTEPGFMDEFDPVVGCTFAVRSAPHDDIVMAEPGPRTAPLPSGTQSI